MPHPDRFYPVVDSIDWVVRLATHGVGTVQLRVKDISHEEAVALVRAANPKSGEWRPPRPSAEPQPAE